MRKIRRNSGKEYITKNGKVVSGKVFENKNYFRSKKCVTLLRCEARKRRLSTFGN